MKKILVTLMGIGVLGGCAGEEGTVRISSKLSEPQAMDKIDARLVMGSEINGDLLAIESVTVRVSEVELEGQNEDENEYETGARTIHVALDGEETDILVDKVPVGEYHFLGVEFAAVGAIVVKGSYNNEAFKYISANNPEIEWKLDEPARVTPNGEAGVSVNFDVGRWFVDKNGNALDPSAKGNRKVIEANIFDTITANAAEVETGPDDDND